MHTCVQASAMPEAALHASAGDSLTNSAARMQEGRDEQQPSASSSTFSQPNPLSSSSPFRCTFYSPAAAVGGGTERAVKRDPLSPSYALPAYDIRCPSPAPFLRSSLDISDIQGAKPKRCAQQLSQSVTGGRELQRAAALLPSSPSRCAVCSAPCSPPCSTWPSVSPPPSLPHQQHPHRFQHSPAVLSVPSLPFSALYSAAAGPCSTAFRFAIDRPFHLPSHQSPIGGDAQPRRQRQQRTAPQPPLRPRARLRLRNAQCRVDCWRESAGEVGRDARGWQGVEWRRMTTEDIQLVQALA